jgi:low temperature requirement protein LtrA
MIVLLRADRETPAALTHFEQLLFGTGLGIPLEQSLFKFAVIVVGTVIVGSLFYLWHTGFRGDHSWKVFGQCFTIIAAFGTFMSWAPLIGARPAQKPKAASSEPVIDLPNSVIVTVPQSKP